MVIGVLTWLVQVEPNFVLSPLESTLTQNAPATLLESTLTKHKDLKPRRINTYRKQGGSPHLFLGRARARLHLAAANRRLSNPTICLTNLLDTTLTGFALVSPVDLTLTGHKDLKSRRITLFRETGGVPLPFHIPRYQPCRAEARRYMKRDSSHAKCASDGAAVLVATLARDDRERRRPSSRL